MVPECEWNVVQSCHNATVIHNIFICYSSKDISKCHVLQIYLSSVRISVRQVVVQWISMRSMLLEIQWKRCSWWKLRHQDVNFYSLSSLFILPSSRAEGLSLILYSCFSFSYPFFLLSDRGTLTIFSLSSLLLSSSEKPSTSQTLQYFQAFRYLPLFILNKSPASQRREPIPLRKTPVHYNTVAAVMDRGERWEQTGQPTAEGPLDNRVESLTVRASFRLH